MLQSWQAGLLAAGALLATSPGVRAGDWCENFEKGLGNFWQQPESQGGLWKHTSYSNETAHGHHVPKTLSGGDGILLLEPSHRSIVVWSMLVSPEMTFHEGATIKIDYWLWFNRTQSDVPLSFMLFRRVDGVEDDEAFLNISAYASVYQSHWASIEAGLDISRGNVFQVSIYGYMAGDGPDMTSDLGLDRIILRGVDGSNKCGGNSTAPTAEPPTEPPQPPTSSEGTTEHYVFFCPAKYGLYIDPYDCHYFYQCNEWHAVHMACPAKLVFNSKKKQCDYRENVSRCN